MSNFEFESPFAVPPEQLYEWHARPGAFGRLLPPWQSAGSVKPASKIANGTRTSFALAKGPFRFRWVAEHRNVEVGRRFTDVQVEGPFRSWEHVHDFQPRNGAASTLSDRIEYQLPMGSLGRAVAGSSLRADLERTFRYRHEVISEDLKLHAAFSDRPRLRVAITGASGLVGSAFADLLTTGGHEVVRISRSPQDASQVEWDPKLGLKPHQALEGLDALVHLAGENIAARRWSDRQMEEIRSSRVVGTSQLVRSLGDLASPPRTFLSASAIGYYGDRGDEPLDERSSSGEGFLSDVCAEWEETATTASELGSRVVLARFGIVLSPRGGALGKMLPPFRLGAGGRIGSGRQWMSWIALDDAIAALYQLLMDDASSGAFNLTSPLPVTNAEFTASLAGVLSRPALVPMPARAAQVAFGRMADEMLLASARVLPERLEEAGYAFRQPTLDGALQFLLGAPQKAAA